MSWASGRVTTREEDIAYCLLGIFDVNMPLLYGEGGKAFMRLQEEIIKRSNDLSIFWNFTPKMQSMYDHQLASEQPKNQAMTVFCPHHQDVHVYSLVKMNCSTCHGTNRNLFASSPRDFARCGDLVDLFYEVLHSTDSRGQNFTLTNTGIHFEHAKFEILMFGTRPDRWYYVMPLGGYYQSGRQSCMMLLEKVAPGLFVRCDVSWHDLRSMSTPLGPNYTPQHVVENAYIAVADPFPSLLEEIRYCYIRIHLAETDIYTLPEDDQLQVVAPKDKWDAAKRAFLLGEGFQKTCVRLNPWYWGGSEVPSSCCYLVCCIARGYLPQVQLLQQQDLDRHTLQLALGEGVGSILRTYPEDHCGTKDDISLDKVTVRVQVNVLPRQKVGSAEHFLVNIQIEF